MSTRRLPPPPPPPPLLSPETRHHPHHHPHTHPHHLLEVSHQNLGMLLPSRSAFCSSQAQLGTILSSQILHVTHRTSPSTDIWTVKGIRPRLVAS